MTPIGSALHCHPCLAPRDVAFGHAVVCLCLMPSVQWPISRPTGGFRAVAVVTAGASLHVFICSGSRYPGLPTSSHSAPAFLLGDVALGRSLRITFRFPTTMTAAHAKVQHAVPLDTGNNPVTAMQAVYGLCALIPPPQAAWDREGFVWRSYGWLGMCRDLGSAILHQHAVLQLACHAQRTALRTGGRGPGAACAVVCGRA
jgi:hypothetical protein